MAALPENTFVPDVSLLQDTISRKDEEIDNLKVANAQLEGLAVREIATTQIDISTNVRTHYDSASLEELANSLIVHGQIHPIEVEPQVDLNGNPTGRYTVLSGHRRFKASHIAKMNKIKCFVVNKKKSDEERITHQIIENVQRDDLSPTDLEMSVKQLMEIFNNQSEVANRLKKSQGWVSQVIQAASIRDELVESPETKANVSTIPATTLNILKKLPKELRPAALNLALSENNGSVSFSKLETCVEEVAKTNGIVLANAKIEQKHRAIISVIISRDDNGAIVFELGSKNYGADEELLAGIDDMLKSFRRVLKNKYS